MLIGIFNSRTDKNSLIKFNGDFLLNDVVSSCVIKETFDSFDLDATFRIKRLEDPQRYAFVDQGCILKVQDETGIMEYFRITHIEKFKHTIKVYARHITITDTVSSFIEDLRPTNVSGAQALAQLVSKTTMIDSKSNVGNVNTAYYMHTSVYEAISSVDNCLLKRFGGEIKRSGFTIEYLNRIGIDSPVTINSSKNLRSLTGKSTADALITRIYAFGYDGITIPEKYIDSPRAGLYHTIYAKKMVFSDIKVKSENNEEGFNTLAEAQEEIRKRARDYFNNTQCDLTSLLFDIDYVDLSATEEFKGTRKKEALYLGDRVRVDDIDTGVSFTARVIEREYDVLANKRLTTTLSNRPYSKVVAIDNLSVRMDNLQTQLTNTYPVVSRAYNKTTELDSRLLGIESVLENVKIIGLEK